VLSSPSGGGKTTVALALVRELPFLKLSRSTTTRAPRGDEREGREYDYISDAEFDRIRDAGGFAEWAMVHAHRYGTSASFVRDTCVAGDCPLLVIDVEGGKAIKRFDPRTVLIFLMPPSLEELENRLKARHTESPADLNIRLNNAAREIAESAKYDYIITNEQLDLAVSQVRRVLLRLRNGQ
jgi:guanylate kinase